MPSMGLEFGVPGFGFGGVTKAWHEVCELSAFCLRTGDSDAEMVSECILECFTQEAPQSYLFLCIWFLNNHLGVNLLCLTPLHCSLNDCCSIREE